MREREERQSDGSQRVVCDSPSSAGEQRKDEQVINTAGCHPGAPTWKAFLTHFPSFLQSSTPWKQYTGPVKQQKMQTHNKPKL